MHSQPLPKVLKILQLMGHLPLTQVGRGKEQRVGKKMDEEEKCGRSREEEVGVRGKKSSVRGLRDMYRDSLWK